MIPHLQPMLADGALQFAIEKATTEGKVTIAVLLVKDAGWMELVPLCITIIVTHLGLLFWELRYVSASLAFPGLKPAKDGR